MVVGVGFLSLIIGAVSERFIASEVEQEVAVAEREVEHDVGRTLAELVAEVRAIGERLREVEARISRIGG